MAAALDDLQRSQDPKLHHLSLRSLKLATYSAGAQRVLSVRMQSFVPCAAKVVNPVP